MTKKQRYVVVRCNLAGCFAGYFVRRNGLAVVLERARRLWSWEGAECLSGLAVYGTTKPATCRFSPGVTVELADPIEIIDATMAGRISIEAVPEWK